MKKIIALLVLCLTVSLLAACGGDTATETGTSADTNAATETPTETPTETGTSADTNAATESATETPTETQTEAETDAAIPANAYLFTVVLGDTDQPAEGVQVQLCQGDSFCLMPAATDAEGKVVYSLGNPERGVYDVHIMEDSLPEGYTFDNASVKTSADLQEYTLTLVKK